MAAREAYALLNDDMSAQVVDVRTQAEWAFVGIPDLSGLSRQPILIEWQQFPNMQINPGFADALARGLAEAGIETNNRLFFLCRSGARSLAAANVMADRGYTNCINISDGFEGDVDGSGHRGRTNGWKAAGLPWRQT